MRRAGTTGVVHTFLTGDGGRFLAALGMTYGVVGMTDGGDVCADYVAIISLVTKHSLKCHLKIR